MSKKKPDDTVPEEPVKEADPKQTVKAHKHALHPVSSTVQARLSADEIWRLKILT